MEIKFKRETRQNFMVLTGLSGEGGLERKLLSGIQDRNLLPFRQSYEEGREACCYDITALQPLKRVLPRRRLLQEDIRFLLLQLDHALSVLEEHMLTERCLLLSPEHIYVDAEQLTARFCAVPGGSFSFEEQMRTLMLTLLEYVQNDEEKAVLLCHRLYQISRSESFCLEDLLRRMFSEPAGEPEAVTARGQREEPNGGVSGRAARGQAVPGRGPGAMDTAEGQEPASYGRKRRKIEAAEPMEPVSAPEQVRLKPEEVEALYGEALEARDLPGSAETVEETPAAATGTRGKRRGSGFFRQLLISLLIMILAPLLVFLLRGAGAVLRILPVFCVIDLSLLIYLGFSFLEKRRRDAVQEEQAAAEAERRIAGQMDQFVEDMTAPELVLDQEAGTDQKVFQDSLYPQEQEEDPRFSTKQLLELENRTEDRRLCPVNKALPEIVVSHFPFVIGKEGRLSDFVLSDSRISRMHLEIDRKGDSYFLTDLNSTNGTSLNGRRLNANERAPLSAGSEISIAGIEYVFF